MQANQRTAEYRSLLDSAYEMLGAIMSNEKIENLPYRDLIYELEQRRQFLEKNRQQAEAAELQKQMQGQRKSQHNRR